MSSYTCQSEQEKTGNNFCLHFSRIKLPANFYSLSDCSVVGAVGENSWYVCVCCGHMRSWTERGKKTFKKERENFVIGGSFHHHAPALSEKVGNPVR